MLNLSSLPKASFIRAVKGLLMGVSGCLLAISKPAISGTTPEQNQRYHYEMAKATLKRQDLSAFNKHYSELETYPLTPYLDYALASKQLSPLTRAPIETFIRNHADTYLGDKLHRQYLVTLAANRAWDDVLFWYKPSLASTRLRCQWLYARIETGDTQAFDQIPEIWVQAKSLPKTCDPIFKKWIHSEHFKPKFAWQRFMLAHNKNKPSLARYISGLLPKSHNHYVQLANELYRRPYKIANYSQFDAHTSEMQDLIAFGVKRYARQSPKQAMKHWQRYEAKHIFPNDIARDTKLYLIKRLIHKGHSDEANNILSVSPSVRDPKIIGQLIRELISEQRWTEVITSIQLLPLNSQQDDRWRYWRTRAQQYINDGSLDANALLEYKSLAKNRSFYGFMAADLLGLDYELEHQPAEFEAEILQTLEQRPSLARAKELWLTGHNSEAYAEWFYGLEKLSARELAAVGVLANRWGWYDRAIHAMIAGKHWNHLGVRFPLAFKEHFLRASKETELPAQFLYAIARQESAMSPEARSHAGARGLMQLMPQTAKQTARKRGITHNTSDLLKADHNIELGSLYLDELLNKYSGNRILAAAAYNAGPHRVKKWMARTGENLPYDAWIETIPFRETRGYVQNVLTFSVIYSYRMGKSERLLTKSEANRKL